MNRDETVDLFLKGKEAWNAWAEKMLAERKAMESDGRWAAEKAFGSLEPKNDETRAWMEAASANFSRCLFLVRGVEGTKEAAGEDKQGSEAQEPPVKSIEVDGEWIDFVGFVFPGNSNFWSTTFTRDAIFGSATFTRDAIFGSATFTGNAYFRSTTFTGYAYFRSATFTGDAYFERATFTGDAYFRSTTFTGNAYFERATFTRDAIFERATFKSQASFRDCRFKGDAIFTAIVTEEALDFIGVRSRRRVPDFLSAKFSEPPLLDNFRLGHGAEPGGLLSSVFLGLIRWILGWLDSALSAKYRRLKQLAIESHDHKNEQIFFRGELRARRYLEDKPWQPAFWLGIIYEIISDFGFSVIRPAIAWALCIVIFAIYFLGQNEEMKLRRDPHFGGLFAVTKEYTRTAWKAFWSPPYCYPGNPPGADSPAPKEDGFSGLVEKARASTDPVSEAFSIAYHNAVIVLDSSGDSAHRAFGCLYGVERYGDNPVAFIPRKVAIASGIQKFLSAIFIFLFGLAVRNMLKVK